jgi:MFS family permease
MPQKASIFSSISSYSKDVKVLLAFSSIVSMMMIMRGVFVPIYLSVLGFSPLLVGTYLTISTLASGITDIGFGLLSDRFGRKKLLLINIVLSSLYFLIPLVTNNVTLILASAIFTYQGSRSPIVNALLADNSTDEDRTNVFTLKLFLGSVLSILGPLISGLPVIFQSYLQFDEVTSFLPLYAVGFGLTIICVVLISLIEESAGSSTRENISIPRDQYHIIMKLAATRVMDTMAVGITLNIFSLWFSIRYNVGIGVVSIVFTFAQVVESLAYLAAPYIAARVGNVKGTVIIRAFGAFYMFSLAFAPTPMIAAILYASRNAFQRVSHPLRESYVMAILDPRVRASGSALINIPRLLISTAGPSIGGYLIEISPFFPPLISGTIFAIGDVLYWVFFKDIKPPEET